MNIFESNILKYGILKMYVNGLMIKEQHKPDFLKCSAWEGPGCVGENRKKDFYWIKSYFLEIIFIKAC
jgi:hypothetical protein